jgi:hypothetical protein
MIWEDKLKELQSKRQELLNQKASLDKQLNRIDAMIAETQKFISRK